MSLRENFSAQPSLRENFSFRSNLITKIFVIAITILLLSGCGFHMRSTHNIPTPLQQLNLEAQNPDGMVAVQLKALLQSLPITLSKNARYTLQLSKAQTQHSKANISNTTQASTISYTQHIQASIVNTKTQHTLIQKTFSASVSQVLNQNQVITSGTNTIATQDLPHNLVTDIYLWLTTNQVRDALTGKTKHKKH